MTIEKRPYVGTWSINNKQVYQHAPDCLVYLNGDVTVPNAINNGRQQSRINFQQFITQVSVDAGTQPGSASASISLSIPIHSNESFVRDANFILRPGLEVHVYMRGYFPAQGMFSRNEDEFESNVPQEAAEDENDQGINPAGSTGQNYFLLRQLGKPDNYTAQNVKTINREQFQIYKKFRDQMLAEYPRDRVLGITQAMSARLGLDTNKVWTLILAESGAKPSLPYGEDARPKLKNVFSTAWGLGQILYSSFGGVKKGAKKTGNDLWWEHGDLFNSQLSVWSVGYLAKACGLRKNTSMEDYATAWAGEGSYKNLQAKLAKANDSLNAAIAAGETPAEIKKLQERVDYLSARNSEVQRKLKIYEGVLKENAAKKNVSSALKEGDLEPPRKPGTAQPSPVEKAASDFKLPRDPENESRDAVPLDDIIAYPYYHVFHGVVTQADISYSGGAQTATLSCSSLLHFWQYHQLGTTASYFGARPSNSKLKMSLVGHPFTGKHPYEIVYTLFHDTAGAAGGVGFALSQKTNQGAKIGNESLFSLNIRYWQKRFSSGRMMKLRMHGVNGQLFNSLQSAYLGRLSTGQINALVRSRYPNTAVQDTTAVSARIGLAGNAKQEKGAKAVIAAQQDASSTPEQASRDLTSALTYQEKTAENAGVLGIDSMIAFVKDINLLGNVTLFETGYQSKLDIINEVTKVTGFEFFQDVDGDFVFKPPFYNMDASTSRVYRIEDIDLISISISEKEPQATYSIGKGSHFKNVIGAGPDNEFGVDGRYIDYRLVAQFGWRPDSFEAMYFTNPRSLFYAAVNRIDLANIESSTASVTIPLRPEIRVGFPFYIVSYDCFYYCNSFSHSWQAGGQCTTSLELVGKRSKFFPPGSPTGAGIEKIDLKDTVKPPVTLEVLDNANRLTLAGMPNAVMALDPTDVNPLFFLVQDDISDMSNPLVLQAVIKIAVDKGRVRETDEPGVYEFDSDDKSKVRRFVVGGQGNTVYKGKEVTNLSEAAVENRKFVESYYKSTKKEQQKLGLKDSRRQEAKTAALNFRREADAATDPAKREAASAKAAKKEEEANRLDQEIKVEQDAINKKTAGLQIDPSSKTGQDVQLLLELMKATGNEVFRDKKRIWGDLNNTANLLELLSDKKATFSANGTPGSYRYFSCSHPDPAQQGIAFSFDGYGAVVEDSRFDQPLAAYGFTPTQKIIRPTDPKIAQPEAELKDQTSFVQRGLYVMRDSPYTLSDGRQVKAVSAGKEKTYRLLLMTSEIQTLEFGVSLMPSKIDQTSGQTTLLAQDFSSLFADGLVAYLIQNVSQAASSTAVTLTDAVFAQFTTLQKTLEPLLPVKLEDLKTQTTTTTTTVQSSPSNQAQSPGASSDNSAAIAASQATIAKLQNQYNEAAASGVAAADPKILAALQSEQAKLDALQGKSGSGKKSGSKSVTKVTKVTKKLDELYAPKYVAGQTNPVTVYRNMANAYASALQASYSDQLNAKDAQLKKENPKNPTLVTEGLNKYKSAVGKALNTMNTVTFGQSNAVFVNQPLARVPIAASKAAKHIVHTPIFPVSDAKGYRVLGTMRYGRGIAMMKDGILDQLSTADPKSALSQEAIQKFVDALAGKESQDKAVQTAVEELSGVYSKNTLINLGVLTPDGKISDNAFANLAADQRDSTQQIPATNAAYSLADLGALDNVPGSTSTRGAEADVVTQAFSMDFVNVVRTGDYSNLRVVNDLLQALPLGPDGQPAVDKASQYQAWSMASKTTEWEQRQDSLRGLRPIQSQPGAASAVKSAIQTLTTLTGGGEE